MSGAAAQILNIAQDGFISLDEDGRVSYWNPRAEELFGIPSERAIGTELAELIVPARYRARHRAALKRIVMGSEEPSTQRRLQLEAMCGDGRELPVEITVTALRSDEGWSFHGWIRDVSERGALLEELERRLRTGSPRFAEILDTLAEAVTIRDAHNHVIYANRAALAQMGFDSLQELQRRELGAIFDDYLLHDESGRRLTMEDIPSVRLFAGEEPEPLVMRSINQASGEVTWQRLKATPLRDEAGTLEATVMIIEDITLEKTAELRERFLARATETLMSSLDYEETLRNVAWLAVPEIADWCVVDLVGPGGGRQRVVVAHPDPHKLLLAEELRRYEPAEPGPSSGVGRVIRTGTSELYPEITDEMLVSGAVDEEHLRLLRAVDFRSVLLVPLRVRDETVGVMTLVTAESARRFDEADKEFAEAVATRAAVAVENSRLATSRHAIAETLQRSLLPDVVPAIEGWQIATLYRAAGDAEEVEVGGDFYDFFPTEQGWVVLLGDVTGKGVEAAALTSLVRHGARFLSKHEHSPSRILAGLDEELRAQPGLWLCSALCIRLHPDRVVVSSAGHPAPLLIESDGRMQEVGAPGAILGAWSGGVWIDRSVPMSEEQTLFIYTDGVTDTRGRGARFGVRRMRRAISEHADKAPAELLAGLENALDRFQRDAQSDDTAALALKLAPVQSGAGVGSAQSLGAG